MTMVGLAIFPFHLVLATPALSRGKQSISHPRLTRAASRWIAAAPAAPRNDEVGIGWEAELEELRRRDALL
ncbi:MAG: hypothetical protein ACEQR8_11660, partial [Cypionkella sp.]